MAREVTRRTMLQLLGGVAAGAVLPPLPWKVLDDASIWTQNWSWLPKLSHGPLSQVRTTCTLCPAGCGVLARCVAGRPYQLIGLRGHPAGGALCPLGLAGHHLALHPLRLAGPVGLAHLDDGHDTPARQLVRRQLSVDDAVSMLARWLREAAQPGADETSVVVLEARTGRVQSLLHQQFVTRLGHGVVASCDPQHAQVSVLRDMLDASPESEWGWDVARTRMILSFAAPLLDGWIAPGLAAQLVGHAAHGGEPGESKAPKLVQVETRPSRTALLADRWIAPAPGSETALALGIGNVIVTEQRYDRGAVALAQDFSKSDGRGYAELVLQFPPERVAQLTGVHCDTIRSVARAFASSRSAVALAGADPCGSSLGSEAERAIWALNVLVGSIGQSGGLVPRRNVPLPETVAAAPTPQLSLLDVPDGSVRLLLLDSTVSEHGVAWPVLRRKLAAHGARVVSLSPFFAGLALHADLIVPAPAPFESLEEVPTPFLAPAATWALATALHAPPPGATMPAELLARLGQSLALHGELDVDSGQRLLDARLAAVHASQRGRVYRASDGAQLDLRDVQSASDLRALLTDGGAWVDDPVLQSAPPRVRLLGGAPDGYERASRAARAREATVGGGFVTTAVSRSQELTLMPFSVEPAGAPDALPAMLSKLCRESHLMPMAGQAFMNPATAGGLGLREGGIVTLENRAGTLQAVLRCSNAVLPGVVHVAVGSMPAGLGDRPSDRRNQHKSMAPGHAALELCPAAWRDSWRMGTVTVTGG